MSSFYRSFSDIFTSTLVIVLINVVGWEKYSAYALISQFVGLAGFALGIYIFIRKPQKLNERNSISHTNEHNDTIADGRLDSTHLITSHNGV